MIYLMADDLTGANDAGVQLAKRGLKTTVYIEPLANKGSNSIEMLEGTDVLVIDTETRDLQAEQGAAVIKRVIENLQLVGKQNILFYKKIDSTFRGNVGKEIETLLSLLKKDLCILAPSYPKHNRVMIG